MVEQRIRPNALGLDVATQASEARLPHRLTAACCENFLNRFELQVAGFHSFAPGLVSQMRHAGVAACAAAEDTFEDLRLQKSLGLNGSCSMRQEEDKHGDHSGLAVALA